MVLVTGADGFLGSKIIRHLSTQGIEVRALVRNPERKREQIENVTYIFGDILDIPSLEEAVSGVESIVHSAAFVSFQPKDKDKLYKVNVEGTANVVNVALHHKVKKIVHISSVEALDILGPGQLIDEKVKLDIQQISTTYGVTKHLSEREVWRGMAEGLEVVILNPAGIIHGSHFNSHPMMMFPLTEQGLTYYMDGYAPFIDMEDMCKIVYRSLTEDTFNGNQYIAVTENIGFKDLVSLLIKVLNVPFNAKPLPRVMQLLGLGFEFFKSKITGKDAQLTKEYLYLGKRKNRFNNKKITTDFQLNLKPIRLSLQEAVALYRKK